MTFPAGDRTYHISNERLKAFLTLTPEQRLQWVEELGAFLRLAKLARQSRSTSQKIITAK